MKALLRSRAAARVVATALVVVFALSFATPAFAALEDPAVYKSSTNPGLGEGYTWRWGWGNTLRPDLIVSTVPSDGGPDDLDRTNGFIYELNQVDASGAPTLTPVWGTSFLTSRSGDGSLISGSYDLLALNQRDGWNTGPGATKYGEGMYFLSLLYYNQFRVESPGRVDRLWFGVDFTPPKPVEGLTSGLASLPSSNSWTEARWRDLRWTPKGYDALSGVGGFAISVNTSEVAFVHNVMPNPSIEPYAAIIGGVPTLSQVQNATLEDLPAGVSTIKVITVDRATNRSTPAVVKAYIDYDTPKISITNPSSGEYLPRYSTMTVKASDGAGVSKVRYYVDNILIGTRTSSPFSLAADLGDFANGTHTLKVVAEDMIGTRAGSWRVPHTATASTVFKLDKKAPTITNVSGGPSPFFPRLRDGYKDNFVARFTSSERGSASITIKDSSGKVWRKMSKSVVAGGNSFTWNGKSDAGDMKAGSFTWTVAVKDATGNRSTTSIRSTSIKFYEVVRVDGRTIRIIPR